MEWGDPSLQFEGTRCGHLRSPARCSTEEGDFRLCFYTIGSPLVFFRKVLRVFESTAQAKHKFYRTKKKDLAACLSMELSGHHDTVEFWVHFFSTQKKVCSTVFGQIGPKVTCQKPVKTSKKVFGAFFACKGTDKIGKFLPLGHSS
jgi:hypothetical protein